MEGGNSKLKYSMQDHCGQTFILQDTTEEKNFGIWMDSTLKFSVHAA